MEDVFKRNFLLAERTYNSKHTRATSSDAPGMSNPANQGKKSSGLPSQQPAKKIHEQSESSEAESQGYS
ncbi:hypothetical protein B9Z55_010888 [Caenorhabditis nigoni]|uniref:Uncharacterized protein n=1 Tax=Caenorhabditis nigoni TaxID=1611254 RepID=A0A2G5UIC5_9PELO|nr:hypothetical protein B9Z55_010888 [Caenorhabditis nigoni]